MSTTVLGPDGRPRCGWCSTVTEFYEYHDTEWGYPVDDDRRLFEKICLESFQSGLSWRTILAKRENFRKAFCNFDFNKVATFTESDVERLLLNKGIIRHRGKIESVINNAKRAQELIEEEGSLAAFFWGFEPQQERVSTNENIATTEESIAIAKALKKKGWKFVGPTTIYAFMQAMGLVNDHVDDCVFKAKIKKARDNFVRPKGKSQREL